MVLPLSIGHVTLTHARLSWTSKSLSLKKCALALRDKLSLVLAKMQKGTPVGSLSNSFVSLSLFRSFVHQSVLTAFLGAEVLVGDLLCHAKTINEPLLFFNLTLLFLELKLHGLELLGEELVLLTNLLS